jgi:hypothetical protein
MDHFPSDCAPYPGYRCPIVAEHAFYFKAKSALISPYKQIQR